MDAYALPIIQLGATGIERVLTLVNNQVVAANVPNFETGTGYLWHKGHLLKSDSETRASLLSLFVYAPEDYSLHLIRLDDAHITEDEAGLALAKMVGGPGVTLGTPHESRVNLHAKHRGLLKIDLERLEQLNEVPGVAVFTLYNEMSVDPDTEVTGAKITPLVYPVEYLKQAEQICAGSPIVDVKPFLPRKIGVIYREVLKESVRNRFIASVQQKLGWFGAEILGVVSAQDKTEDLTRHMQGFNERGAELVLHVGGHASDPLDPIFGTLTEIGARMERQGAPAHPGSLFWLAYQGEMAIFGLASCGMFSRTTLGDLFLAKFCAGEHITSRDLAKVGHGGLFTHEMAFRFPSYS